MYLLDTVVLSELRKSRRDPSLTGWLEHIRPTDVYLSVVTIGEVEKGIAQQQRRDPAFAIRLAGWLDGVLRYYATRILAVDVNVARRWGRLAERPPPWRRGPSHRRDGDRAWPRGGHPQPWPVRRHGRPLDQSV